METKIFQKSEIFHEVNFYGKSIDVDNKIN